MSLTNISRNVYPEYWKPVNLQYCKMLYWCLVFFLGVGGFPFSPGRGLLLLVAMAASSISARYSTTTLATCTLPSSVRRWILSPSIWPSLLADLMLVGILTAAGTVNRGLVYHCLAQTIIIHDVRVCIKKQGSKLTFFTTSQTGRLMLKSTGPWQKLPAYT